MTWQSSPEAHRQMWQYPLRRLQLKTGIPLEFALAHFAHEGLNGDNTLSQLAAEDSNWAGLKYASWMKDVGAVMVDYPTQEVNKEGAIYDTVATFASFPDTGTFLRAYAALLQMHYREAFHYSRDALLFGYMVWVNGWATDPDYIFRLAQRMIWCQRSLTAPRRKEQ